MAGSAHLASHRQTLYFASLHCQQLAQERSADDGVVAEPLQYRQCLLEAATDCLYRSSVFLAQHLAGQSAASIPPPGQDAQAFSGWLAQLQATPTADPAIQTLLTAFSAPNPLAGLLTAYQALWLPASTAPRSTDHLRLVDTTVSLARCTEWHELLGQLGSECIALQAEF